MKLSEKIKQLQEEELLRLKNDPEQQSKFFFSFEYFPPKTEAGITGLYNVLDKMIKKNPVWVDVTWGES